MGTLKALVAIRASARGFAAGLALGTGAVLLARVARRREAGR